MFKMGDLSGAAAKNLVGFFVEATGSDANFYPLAETKISLFEEKDALLAHMESPLQSVLVQVPYQASGHISIVWHKEDFESSNEINPDGNTEAKTGEFILREEGDQLFQSQNVPFEGDIKSGIVRRQNLCNLVRLIQLSLD